MNISLKKVCLFVKSVIYDKKEEPKNKEKEIFEGNLDLITKLNVLGYADDLYKIFNSPVGKLYTMELYSRNIDELLNNISQNISSKNIISVNVNAYFNIKQDKYNHVFKSLAKYLQNNKINQTCEFDLNHIYETYETLKGM